MARAFDLSTTDRTDRSFDFDDLNERRLVETLQRNKVAIYFEKNLETLCGPRDKLFNEFPAIKLFYQGLHAKIEKDSSAFNKVENEFSKEGIEFILIKSADSYPYESDNLDVLIKPNELAKVAQILRGVGYVELRQAREKHKFLFRKAGNYHELPLHIHTRVEWEGVQFVDSLELWHRHSTAANGGFFTPSPEDCILVTIAHLFFENHEIGLLDLLKLELCIRNYDIDWDYVIRHARKLGWIDALYLTLLLVDRSYALLLHGNLLPRKVLSDIEGSIGPSARIMLKTIRLFDSGLTPIRIPYIVSAFYFVQRVMCSSGSDLPERLKSIHFVVVDVLRRRILPVKNIRMDGAYVDLLIDRT